VIVASFSYDASKAVGKAMISTASALFVVGKTIVIATSTAGVVLVTDSANGTAQILNGKIQTGSSTIIASISDSSKAFGSTMVEGLQLKK
jgi:Na+/alanine symporter